MLGLNINWPFGDTSTCTGAKENRQTNDEKHQMELTLIWPDVLGGAEGAGGAAAALAEVGVLPPPGAGP